MNRMIRNIKTILFVIALFWACTPSLYQLQQIEFASYLEKELLQIPIKDATEEIALFEKYGQHKKANRLRNKTQRENERLKTAIDQELRFCAYEFVSEHSIDYSKPWLNLQEEALLQEDRDAWQLSLEIIENGEVKVTSINRGNSPNLQFALRQLNQKLQKLADKAVR